MLVAALLSALAPASTPDPCTVLPTAQVQSFLGESITKTAKEGPEPDEATGGTITTCTFLGKTRMFFVSVVEFTSAGEATRKISAQFIKERNDEATVEAEPGVGDRAWFGRSPNAAMLVSQRGARAYAVGIGGKIGPDAGSYRAGLHKFVAGIAATR